VYSTYASAKRISFPARSRSAPSSWIATSGNDALPPTWSQWWWVLATRTSSGVSDPTIERMSPMPRPESIRTARSRPATRKLFTCPGSATSHVPGASSRVANQSSVVGIAAAYRREAVRPGDVSELAAATPVE
jgi:hypothetical protein